MIQRLSSSMGREGFSFLDPFTTQEALPRCGQISYRKPKKEDWM
ncbi:hypothetical protein LINPERHAP1_LOCUS27069 [Linum perenne]